MQQTLLVDNMMYRRLAMQHSWQKVLYKLNTNPWVASKSLQEVSLSHTKVISNLKKGKYDGWRYLITSEKNEYGINGYVLHGRWQDGKTN